MTYIYIGGEREYKAHKLCPIYDTPATFRIQYSYKEWQITRGDSGDKDKSPRQYQISLGNTAQAVKIRILAAY